jgi:hypothetical protein
MYSIGFFKIKITANEKEESPVQQTFVEQDFLVFLTVNPYELRNRLLLIIFRQESRFK